MTLVKVFACDHIKFYPKAWRINLVYFKWLEMGRRHMDKYQNFKSKQCSHFKFNLKLRPRILSVENVLQSLNSEWMIHSLIVKVSIRPKSPFLSYEMRILIKIK